MAIVIHSFTYQKLDASFAHLFASLVGMSLAAWFWRKSPGRRYPPGPWSDAGARSGATGALGA